MNIDKYKVVVHKKNTENPKKGKRWRKNNTQHGHNQIMNDPNEFETDRTILTL